MFRTIIAASLMSAGAVPALAQSQDPIQQVLANFDRIDINGDGVISSAEYRTIQVGRWPQIDRNGDGFLTLEDVPRIAAGRARAQLEQIAYLDANGDGRISQSEFLDGPPPVFRRADSDADGALTRSEVEAAAS